GPEFVRKHIFNKHAEKIEEVKKEVAFFNNFLTDAKRPALPEIKPAQPPGPAQILPPGLTPGLPYPHQTPQGLMPYGQPRPPILGYGGWFVETQGPLWNIGTWMPQTTLISFEPSPVPHSCVIHICTTLSHQALRIFCTISLTANKSTST
ncbi:SRRT isoform 6, partial [Pongo abelii]